MYKRSASSISISTGSQQVTTDKKRSPGHNRLSISVKPEVDLYTDLGHIKDGSFSLENAISLSKGHYVPRFSIRMVLLGDSNIGKTTMISTLMQNSPGSYHQRTIGADFFRHIIPSLSVDIKIVDMSGHRAFHSKLCPAALSKKPDVICMVYSTANRITLESLTIYWAKRLEDGDGLNEGCRVVLIGNNQHDYSGRQTNETLAKTTASKLAKTLEKKQVDIMEINAEDQDAVLNCFESLAEKAAYRILYQLTKQLRKNAANLIQTKLILRKSGFSEDFVSKYRLEPLCTLVKDQTGNKEFDANEYVATNDHENDEVTSESTKWLEIRGREIFIFTSVKEARHGTAPIRNIVLDRSRCKIQLIADMVLNINEETTNNLFIPNSKDVARHWYSAIQEILLGEATSE